MTLKEAHVGQNYQYRSSFRYIVNFGDTLQSIAKSQTGSESNWHFIAQENGITRPAELQAGDVIIVPALTAFGEEAPETEEFIISEVSDRVLSSGQDLHLGTDVFVDAEAGVVLDINGNPQTVSGADNVRQALDRRLQTKLGSLLPHSETYGTNVVVGISGTALSRSYVQMSVENTLIKDPRVAQVLNVNVSSEGDILHVEAEIRLIRNAGDIIFETTIGG